MYKRYPATVAFLIFFFAPSVSLFTQDVAVSINSVKGSYSITLSVNNMKSDEILKSLSDGLRAEISHHIRIYRKANGIFRFLGDRLVEESSPTIIAGWDIFRRQYIVEDNNRRITYCTSAEEFLKTFFHCTAYTISSEFSDPDSYYVLVQSNIRAVKIVPPFTILSSILPLGAITTSWTRQEFKSASGIQE